MSTRYERLGAILRLLADGQAHTIGAVMEAGEIAHESKFYRDRDALAALGFVTEQNRGSVQLVGGSTLDSLIRQGDDELDELVEEGALLDEDGDDEDGYSVSFSISTDADRATYDYCAGLQASPQTLEEIREVCREYGVSATLRNEAGSIVGAVDKDGEWFLS